MGSSVYVASLEGHTGKSTVALGLLEQLSRRVQRVGVYRPIVREDTEAHGGRDYVLDLLTSHDAVTLPYDESVGVTYADVHADPDAALDRIVERYHRVADRCDAVVVVGSDYTDVGTPTEFSYNARIAANLGAPVLLVLNGSGAPRTTCTPWSRPARRSSAPSTARCSPSSPTGSTATSSSPARTRSRPRGCPPT